MVVGCVWCVVGWGVEGEVVVCGGVESLCVVVVVVVMCPRPTK